MAAIGDPREVVQVYRQHNLDQERVSDTADGERAGGRWGDGAADIVEAWLEDSGGRRVDVVPQGERACLRMRVRFATAMEEPIFGVIVKDERGEHVFVTNTMHDGVSAGSFAADDEAEYRLRFQVLLSDGRYTASPAVAHQDGQRFADWREDFISFSVRAERYSGGIVDLPHETEIERAS